MKHYKFFQAPSGTGLRQLIVCPAARLWVAQTGGRILVLGPSYLRGVYSLLLPEAEIFLTLSRLQKLGKPTEADVVLADCTPNLRARTVYALDSCRCQVWGIDFN